MIMQWGELTTILFCLIIVANTNSQLPTLFLLFYFEKAHYNLLFEKLVWLFSSAYLDGDSRQAKYYKTSTKVNEGTYYKINVGHTKFQPTIIFHPH
jgi:hypothetical protein